MIWFAKKVVFFFLNGLFGHRTELVFQMECFKLRNEFCIIKTPFETDDPPSKRCFYLGPCE